MKNKIKLLLIVGLVSALSSCGLFHKSCNCPHFSQVKGIAAHPYLS